MTATPEGWLDLQDRWHFVRAGATLCGIPTARTDFDGNARLKLTRLNRDCAACWAVLGRQG